MSIADVASVVENYVNDAIPALPDEACRSVLVPAVADARDVNSRLLLMRVGGASGAHCAPSSDPGMRVVGVEGRGVGSAQCVGAEWGYGAWRVWWW